MQLTDSLHEDEKAEGISPYLLWGIWLMWLPFLIQPVTDLIQMPSSPQKIASATGLLLFIAAYLWASWQEAYRLTRAPLRYIPLRRTWWAPVALLIVLSIVLPFVQGAWGLGGFIYTSASVAGCLKVRQALLTFGGLMLLTVVIGVLTTAPWATIALMVFLVPAVGGTVAIFSHAFWTNRALRQARREIARLAVSEERLRFARDLHDLLGHTLSLITIKSELAGQLIPEDPVRAQQEVRDIESSARTALQEVREAVAGYRQSTLASELQRAQELLSAAGIQWSVQNKTDALPASIEALLTWVVREGVTNVIRHSQARQCILSLTQQSGEVHMTVIDDGQGSTIGRNANLTYTALSGNGLRGIAERVTVLGGSCKAGPADDGGFLLTVSLPLRTGRGKQPVVRQAARAKGEAV